MTPTPTAVGGDPSPLLIWGVITGTICAVGAVFGLVLPAWHQPGWVARAWRRVCGSGGEEDEGEDVQQQ